jgi:hypothetical protein
MNGLRLLSAVSVFCISIYLGYRSLAEAKMDIGSYLMGYYNQRRPHHLYGGVSPQAAEKNLKLCPVSVCHYKYSYMIRFNHVAIIRLEF